METKMARRSLLPRPTLRLRLTLLYGALFLISGAALLAITYLFVLHTAGAFTRPAIGAELGLTPQQAQALTQNAQAQFAQQDASQKQALLFGSGIALGFMAVISMVLGWIVAGRILKPLRTITAAARRISATSLHERLAMGGPNDEIKELGDTFDALLARLESSFQSQLRFIANASHELRTPLARQRVLAQVALADPNATVESLRTAHERVLVSGAEEELLIEALLTLARGQTGLNRKEPVDLAAVAERVLLMRDSEIKRRNLELGSSLATASANGDPILIERLVANLVDNALRHNVVNGRLQVGTETRDGKAVLSVANTGPVVPAMVVERLFEPFQRLGSDRTGPREGVGLGLSIVRAIADAHDAAVRIRPRPEGGLDIEVAFPAAETN
jgi:signal transduction histidine kinase